MVVPPLKQHKEYIGALVPVLLSGATASGSKALSETTFTTTAARALIHHTWPFNIRELKLVIETAVTKAQAERDPGQRYQIDVRHLPPGLTAPLGSAEASSMNDSPDSRRPRRALRAFSDTEILQALESAGGNRADAARTLGVSERTIFRRLRKLSDRPE